MLFDFDGTLIQRQEVFAKWAAEFAEKHGVPLAWLLEADARCAPGRMEFFERVKSRFGMQPTVAELNAQYRQRMSELITLDRQVHAMLADLRESGWRLGVVTNGTADRQTAKLVKAGLYDLVDAVVVAGVVGVWKPDARIFRHATARLGVQPGPHVVMVGDSLEQDVAGARIAGLSTVWVSHDRLLPRPGPRPRHTIRTVTEAGELLRDIVS
ncbi:HAD family hydrolase [Streptomyces sp. AV19]|uniref:HAD family hydrolase n=1 Tax=Streptomyces sp. AV19 TaxID=2793068 RepID=UPI0018FE1702|nr:HAD family hydrolase [Streptomyces sp. AV19]MBH1936902.1 HAD family hydrolase [Streptomyces sp. AV19]MDG4532943.1 HAD family hydrolase [Streptomyces sp. AV19]